MGRGNPKVSVVMPVYNVDRHVARAVESLRNQSLDDIEVIIVDDGSTDRTGSIVDHIAERDIRLEVIHTASQGLPAACCLALGRARGTYVCFLGGGDWVQPDALFGMLELAEGRDLELVVSGFHVESPVDGSKAEPDVAQTVPPVVYESREDFRSDAYRLFDHELLCTPRNMLFLRSRIEELGLCGPCAAQDGLSFVLGYVRDVRRVGVIGQACHHLAPSCQWTHDMRWTPELYDACEAEHGGMLELYEHWGLSDDLESMEMVQRRYIEHLVSCIEGICGPACGLSRRERLEQIRRMISSDRAQLAARVAGHGSVAMRAMLVPIRAQNAHLAYVEGRLAATVGGSASKVLARMRGSR